MFLLENSKTLVTTDISSDLRLSQSCVIVCVKTCVKHELLLRFLKVFPTKCAGLNPVDFEFGAGWNTEFLCVILCVNFVSEMVVESGKKRHYFDTQKIKKP